MRHKGRKLVLLIGAELFEADGSADSVAALKKELEPLKGEIAEQTAAVYGLVSRGLLRFSVGGEDRGQLVVEGARNTWRLLGLGDIDEYLGRMRGGGRKEAGVP